MVREGVSEDTSVDQHRGDGRPHNGVTVSGFGDVSVEELDDEYDIVQWLKSEMWLMIRELWDQEIARGPRWAGTAKLIPDVFARSWLGMSYIQRLNFVRNLMR